MCYKLVDGESGKIVCRSVFYSATESGTANLRVDLIKSLPHNSICNTDPDDMLDELIATTDLNHLFQILIQLIRSQQAQNPRPGRKSSKIDN